MSSLLLVGPCLRVWTRNDGVEPHNGFAGESSVDLHTPAKPLWSGIVEVEYHHVVVGRCCSLAK